MVLPSCYRTLILNYSSTLAQPPPLCSHSQTLIDRTIIFLYLLSCILNLQHYSINIDYRHMFKHQVLDTAGTQDICGSSECNIQSYN